MGGGGESGGFWTTEVEGDLKAPSSLASARGEGWAPLLSLVFPQFDPSN